MKIPSFLRLAATAVVLAGTAHAADVVFDTDFTKGTIEELGWKPDGLWTMAEYSNASNNPGPVLKFPKSETPGTLTKTFEPLKNPRNLTLTFEGGYGWGAPGHVQSFQVKILDDKGNGYVLGIQRANAPWAAQWGKVTDNKVDGDMKWGNNPIDTTQQAIVDGGGLRKFTITRSSSGEWTLDGEGWQGGPLIFVEPTTDTFSQIVVVASPNTDEFAFSKFKLEVEK